MSLLPAKQPRVVAIFTAITERPVANHLEAGFNFHRSMAGGAGKLDVN
jgi:hypothetical protein